MSISDNTISQDVWTSVRNKLVAANLFATNTATSTTIPANITGSHPDNTLNKPHVVINSAQIPESEFRFGGTEGKKFINVLIDVYAPNSQFMDQISDQIRVAIKADDIEGMSLIDLADTVAFINPAFQKYHQRTFTAVYVR